MAHTPGDMHVQVIPLDQMNPAPYNPAVELAPGDPEYEAIKASIREFGLIDPLIWNKRTGNIVGGHQRYRVLHELGYAHADAVVLDLDDEAERRANLALRKAQGKWDEVKLSDLLAHLRQQSEARGTPFLPPAGFHQAELEEYFQKNRAFHAADFLSGLRRPDNPDGTPSADPFANSAFSPQPSSAPSMAPPRDGSFRQPDSPLDGLDGEDGGEDAGEWEDDGPAPLPDAPQQPYVTLQYAVTLPQRDEVMGAIKLAKTHFGLGNSIEALVAICMWYAQSRGSLTEAPKP